MVCSLLIFYKLCKLGLTKLDVVSSAAVHCAGSVVATCSGQRAEPMLESARDSYSDTGNCSDSDSDSGSNSEESENETEESESGSSSTSESSRNTVRSLDNSLKVWVL